MLKNSERVSSFARVYLDVVLWHITAYNHLRLKRESLDFVISHLLSLPQAEQDIVVSDILDLNPV